MDNTSKVVLVIEDNETNMRLLHDMLEARRYNVLQAGDGATGFRIASERHPDLILMDIQLPDVSGLEVTRQLRADETLKSIPIVAVTAFALDGDKERILASGCDAYVAKPISIRDCLRTIESFLAKSETAQAA